MLTYILKRLLYALPIALSVTVVSFMLVYLAPGDPLNAIAPADALAEVIDALKSAYGLDRPVPVQYGLWLWRAVQGDLGTSIASGRAVVTEVFGAVGNTLLLAGIASGLGVLVGCVLGALAGYKHGSGIDRAATALSVVGVSIPHYWLGLVLTIIFSTWLGWFPARRLFKLHANVNCRPHIIRAHHARRKEAQRAKQQRDAHATRHTPKPNVLKAVNHV